MKSRSVWSAAHSAAFVFYHLPSAICHRPSDYSFVHLSGDKRMGTNEYFQKCWWPESFCFIFLPSNLPAFIFLS
ncbi:MAG: hypothetical protein C5B50_08260 [Verrucomicrobia bacterium]|nr:MAG: hypothetical protein C5B50_08260 [Verrucomicrobiota bacterium]